MKPKVLKSNSKAEILSITLKLKNNKICIKTCYRVATLSQSNLSEISKHIQQIASMKSIINRPFIGGMNLDSVDWTENSSNVPLHNDFLSLFDSLNLTQLINAPTHYRGKILDILLSDIPSTIFNIVIRGHNEHVISDHYAITFNLIFNKLISRRKGLKRTIRNFKKANWREIKNAFNDWHQHVDYLDINSAWNNFKEILNSVCNQHIPNITIQSKQNLPWFDSDIHKLFLKKDRLRLKYKQSQNRVHYQKFSQVRKELKATMISKMRANLTDTTNPNAITKNSGHTLKIHLIAVGYLILSLEITIREKSN